MLVHQGFWESSKVDGYFRFTRKSDGADWNQVLRDMLTYDANGVPMTPPPFPWLCVKDGIVESVSTDPSKLVPMDLDVYTTDLKVEAGMLFRDGQFTTPPPPVKSTDPVDYPLRRWEFTAMVEYLGVREKIEAAIEAIPGKLDRAIARARYVNSDYYAFGDALLQQLRAAVGLTLDELRAAWMYIVGLRPVE